jgi:tetratricopeptide (TPR) repeat protein
MIRLAGVYAHQDRVEEAEEVLSDLIPAFQRQGLTEQVATCRYMLGNLARRKRRLSEALDHHREALEARRLFDAPPHELAASLTAYGGTFLDQGDYPAALALFDEAVETIGDDSARARDLSFALIGKGRVLGRLGNPKAARPLLQRALSLREGRDDRIGEAIARLDVARNLLDLDQYEAAFEEAGRARFQLDLLSGGTVLAEADQILGRIRLARRRFDEARQHFDTALERHVADGDEIGAAFDEAWLLETALLCSQASAADRAVRALQERRAGLRQVELSELLDYRLFRGLDWLSQRGIHLGDPISFLERAYEQVLVKAERLEGDQRHRYLFEVDHNREIVEAARGAGLAG